MLSISPEGAYANEPLLGISFLGMVSDIGNELSKESANTPANVESTCPKRVELTKIKTRSRTPKGGFIMYLKCFSLLLVMKVQI